MTDCGNPIDVMLVDGQEETRLGFALMLRHDPTLHLWGQAADSLSNAEIAERLVIQSASAKRAVSRILAKLGMRDRTQVAVSWWRAGL